MVDRALALLLICIVAGTFFTIDSTMKFHTGQPVLILGLLLLGHCERLVAGFWTSVAGCLAIAVSAAEVLVRGMKVFVPAILLAAMGDGLALLGPGALSIDALIFGYRESTSTN